MVPCQLLPFASHASHAREPCLQVLVFAVQSDLHKVCAICMAAGAKHVKTHDSTFAKITVTCLGDSLMFNNDCTVRTCGSTDDYWVSVTAPRIACLTYSKKVQVPAAAGQAIRLSRPT
jgi:hypothetical protein